MNEPIDLLRCHFGLTPAEARLALHLVAGTLRSAAVKLSITYETARTHLKNIFSKTGTCRQADLSWSSLPLFLAALAQPNKTLTQVNKFRDGFKATNERSGPEDVGEKCLVQTLLPHPERGPSLIRSAN